MTTTKQAVKELIHGEGLSVDKNGNVDNIKAPVYCPSCEVDPQEKCQAPSGQATYLHQPRLKLWARKREEGNVETDNVSGSNGHHDNADLAQALEDLREYGPLGQAVETALQAIEPEAQTTTLTVKTPESTEVEIRHKHEMFDELLGWIQDGHGLKDSATNPYLCGPPGSGKGTLAGQVADAFEKDLVIIPMSPDDMVYDLTGFTDANGNKVDVPLTEAWESDNLILFDELDRARVSTLTRLNEALSSGRLETPHGTLHRHPDGIIIGAGNTDGHGGDEAHTSANSQDLASMSRWAPHLDVDYDPDLEKALAKDLAGSLGEEWANVVREVRQTCRDLGIQRHPADTRAVLAGARSLGQNGESAKSRVAKGFLVNRLGRNAERITEASDTLEKWL